MAAANDLSVVNRAGPAGGPAAAHRRWTLAAASLGFAVIQLDVSVVNVAIKPIGASLGGGVSALQWVVNAYTVAFAALILCAAAALCALAVRAGGGNPSGEDGR
jgi:MFS transporter, DHA2 family, methylenomycin A resistance protein